jgi:hypothetical protein
VRSLVQAALAAVVLCLATPAVAQTSTNTPDEQLPDAPQGGPVGTMLPEDLSGRDIVDITGATVGTIEDVVIDSQGNATLLMVGMGGLLGIGSRTVALDPASITLEQGGDLLTSLTKDQIELLPAYEKSDGGWQLQEP